MEKIENQFIMTKKTISDWSYKIIGCAIEVHRQLGPGLMESVYETCLFHELIHAGFQVERQQKVAIIYKGLELEATLRLDLLVNNCIIIENKTADMMSPVFQAQLLTYMKLLQKPKGLIFNFFTHNLKSSMVSMVNEYYALLPDE